MKEIVILGQRFSIKVVTKETLKNKTGDHVTESYGAMELVPRVIYLNRELRGDQLKRILIHEIIHAYIGLAGLTEFTNNKTEEALCCVLENLVDQFTNPKVIDFMNSKKPEGEVEL